MVENLCIEFWFHVSSAIGDSRICTGKFKICYAICKTAECKGKISVILCKGWNAKAFSILISEVYTDFLKSFNCNDIYRLGYSHSYIGKAAVRTIIIVESLWTDSKRCIILYWSERKSSRIKSSGITAYDLESRSRLTACVSSTVPCSVAGFITTSTDKGFDFACRLIDDSHGNLWF